MYWLYRALIDGIIYIQNLTQEVFVFIFRAVRAVCEFIANSKILGLRLGGCCM